jgi:hypothetical protein
MNTWAKTDHQTWGTNTRGQAVRYEGSTHWDIMGGPAFTEIGAGYNTVVAVTVAGRICTHVHDNQWHLVSGAKLIDAAELNDAAFEPWVGRATAPRLHAARRYGPCSPSKHPGHLGLMRSAAVVV